MNIKEIVIKILSPLDIPIRHQVYEGKETTYITFFEYLEKGESYYDDLEENTGHYIQIDLWSKGDLEDLKKSTVRLLKNEGFIKRSINDLYEPDTKIFHKCLRFFYCSKNDEED